MFKSVLETTVEAAYEVHDELDRLDFTHHEIEEQQADYIRNSMNLLEQLFNRYEADLHEGEE